MTRRPRAGWLAPVPFLTNVLLPPRDSDVWRIDCSGFQHIGPKDGRPKRAADWTWNRNGHSDWQIPERFTYVTFSTRRVRRAPRRMALPHRYRSVAKAVGPPSRRAASSSA
ncbi:MAG: hypothetical protein FJW34_05010 [Acidobacteria bacterium]|nr:hypothetical protein [Acidobacteriota bacterium]